MPDRHGPLKVIYEETFSQEGWNSFESETSNDVLDRITRGILNVSPQWLGRELTEAERAAVLEAFGEELPVEEPREPPEGEPAT